MKNKNSLCPFILSFLVIILIVGCAGSSGELIGPTAVPLTNTPVPLTDTPIPPTSTPEVTTGEVKGTLVNSGDSPVKAAMLLTAVTVSSDGSFTMALDALSTAEKGESDSTGYFIFKNLDPGHYIITAMVSSSGTGSTLKDEQDNVVIIEVKVGEVVDLGKLTVK